MSDDKTAKYAERIANLLKMAESGDDAEAQAAQEMAERLMTRYGIERAVAMAQGEQRDEQIITEAVKVKGIYAKVFAEGIASVARQLNVETVWHSWRNEYRIKFVGYESDITSVKTLFTSLMLQSVSSATKALRDEYVINKYGSASNKFNFRRSHILGFFHGASDRIASTRRQVFTETTGSELAVRDRAVAVRDKLNELFPSVRAAKGTQVNAAYYDGVESGRNAMTGEAQLKQKGQIGS